MDTIYHLQSAQEASNKIIEDIKNTYKSKAIKITIEEEDTEELSDVLKAILDDRLQEDEGTYLSSEESIQQLKDKYGV